MRKLKMWTYKAGSEGGKLLAQAMGVKRIRHKNSKYRWSKNKLVLNWGSTNRNLTSRWLNDPERVFHSVDKVNTFACFKAHDVPCPPHTKHQHEAQAWLDAGKTVFARTITNGAEGRGIVVVKPGDKLPYAKLYTLYIPKKAEYRIHVVDGKAIDIQQKVRKKGHENKDFHVRNTANGFIFIRGGVEAPAAVVDAGVRAVGALGLHFGAVDVIWNDKKQQALALEVNTAPGIMGTSVAKYSEALKALALRNL